MKWVSLAPPDIQWQHKIHPLHTYGNSAPRVSRSCYCHLKISLTSNPKLSSAVKIPCGGKLESSTVSKKLWCISTDYKLATDFPLSSPVCSHATELPSQRWYQWSTDTATESTHTDTHGLTRMPWANVPSWSFITRWGEVRVWGSGKCSIGTFHIAWIKYFWSSYFATFPSVQTNTVQKWKGQRDTNQNLKGNPEEFGKGGNVYVWRYGQVTGNSIWPCRSAKSDPTAITPISHLQVSFLFGPQRSDKDGIEINSN